jgi:hypothetical protein
MLVGLSPPAVAGPYQFLAPPTFAFSSLLIL